MLIVAYYKPARFTIKTGEKLIQDVLPKICDSRYICVMAKRNNVFHAEVAQLVEQRSRKA